MPTFTPIAEALQLSIELSRLWDKSCRDCGTDFPYLPVQTACKDERQDYAEGFGVSSEAFIQGIQLFETAFPHET
jgi:hypothetical protein